MIGYQTDLWIRAHECSRPPTFCSASAHGHDRVSGSVVLYAPSGTPVPGSLCGPCAEAVMAEYAAKLGKEWYSVPVYQHMGLAQAAKLEREAVEKAERAAMLAKQKGKR